MNKNHLERGNAIDVTGITAAYSPHAYDFVEQEIARSVP